MKCTLLTVAISVGLLVPQTAAGQPKHYPLESTAGLRLHNVVAEPATLQGKKGLRITGSEEAQRRLQTMTPDEQARFPQLASIDGLEFANGVIEAEIAGAPAPGVGGDARGFVGIAFRLQNDWITYDAFYLAPQWLRRRSRATESSGSVHFAPRLAVVPASQREPIQI